MSATSAPLMSPRVEPTHERAIRALKALDEGRWVDARKNADALPDVPIAELAWKTYLRGRVHLALNELKQAEVALERTAALAMEWAPPSENTGSRFDAIRLSAEALEHLGRVYRRGERGERAIRAHLAAYRLRCEHGSAFEPWESAESLAVDYSLRGEFVEAKSWYERAIGHALSAGVECQAKSLGGLSAVQLAQGDSQAATEAARAACELWRNHSAGSVTRFLAEKQLGLCALRQAEARFEADPLRAGELVAGAIAVLAVAHREIAAFGAEASEEARECAELLDFARRLGGSPATV